MVPQRDISYITIGRNTLWILAKNNLFLESKDLNQESRGVYKNKILRVDEFRPNNTTVTHKVYYSEIIKLAKKYFLKKFIKF